MRFAEFWYSANGLFDAVRENCSRIARESGLKLNADDAFRWLSFGGLTDDVPGQVGVGGLDLSGVKQVMGRFMGGQGKWLIDGMNTFKLNLAGATQEEVGLPVNGRIVKVACWRRQDRKLVAVGVQGQVIEALMRHSDIDEILKLLRMGTRTGTRSSDQERGLISAVQALESMAANYWVTCSEKKGRPTLKITTPEEWQYIYTDKSGTLR